MPVVPATAPDAAADRRAWATVLLVFGAGIVSAFQVGKAPMALGAVQSDLRVSLEAVSWLISALAIVGAAAGAPVGLVVDRIGARRMAAVGLLLQGLGSALGAFSPGFGALVLTRVIEGMGFLGLIVAAPALIAASVPARMRGRAMGLWASFLPVGMALVLLAAPLLPLLTWRGFWVANAVIPTVYAALLGLLLPAARGSQAPRPVRRDIVEALCSPGPWLLAGLFAAFSSAFFAVFGFLPLLLAEWFGIGGEQASVWSAGVIVANGVGSIAGGHCLARGMRPRGLLLTGFLGMAVCGAGIYGAGAPPAAAYALCLVFSAVAGLIPAAIYDSAQEHAPRPELLGVTLGFAMQGNNVGILFGPVAAAGIAAAYGWPALSLLIAVVALAAIWPLTALRRFREGARSGAGGLVP